LEHLKFAGSYEIIIVDDASDDGTREFLDIMADKNIIIIHNKRNLGPSLSRNLGVKKSKYNIIAFIDDDCEANKYWLTNICKNLIDKKTAFTIGQTFYVGKSYKGHFPERVVSNLNASWPMSSNMAVNKEIFLKLAGFCHEFYKFYKNEDTEFAIRAVSKGFSFEKCVDAIVYHQKATWTSQKLLKTARNLSVWPVLKKKYPKHYLIFQPKNIIGGIFICPEDSLLVIVLPILLIRYLISGNKDLKVFFAKWPLLILIRRYYIWKEVLVNKVLML
jgi:GT2 family glycosyltransferase